MVDQGEVWGWETFFTELRSFIDSCDRQRGIAQPDFASYAIERLQIAVQNVTTIGNVLRNNIDRHRGMHTHVDVLSRYSQYMDNLVRALHSIILDWETYLEDLDQQRVQVAYHAPVVRVPNQRGRPQFHVTGDQLEFLRSLSFSWTEIASLLHVSRMTVYRRRRELGLLDEPVAVPTDRQLGEIVREIRLEAPALGQSLMLGRLRAMGYRVTRQRIREAMRSQDPLNTALRMPGGLTARRQYAVAGPNSLWHIGKSKFLLSQHYPQKRGMHGQPLLLHSQA